MTEPHGPLDVRVLVARLRVVAAVLAVLALAGTVVDGLVNGLSFGLMARWAGLLIAALAVTTAVLVAVHALRGAGSSQARGERLSGPDVGLLPPRRPRD